MAQHRLWTPIANSFEAYRRRLIADPKAIYEHIWRLVHIEESLVVTVGQALACRLMSLWIEDQDKLEELNHLRRMVTGLGVSGEEILQQNCLTGSIDAWINILQRFGKPSVTNDCEFCSATSEYLFEEIQEGIAFADVWSRIAPVPETHLRERLSRLDRIRSINNFRNKIAHVPISHKSLSAIHQGLRAEIIKLLSPDSNLIRVKSDQDLRTHNFHPPLKGTIANAVGSVSGSDYQQLSAEDSGFDGERYFWGENTRWEAVPFAKLDEELKVTLLFRVNSLVDDPELDEFQAEYHRFAAEIEPVRREPVVASKLERWFPETPKRPTDETSDEPGDSADEPASSQVPADTTEPEDNIVHSTPELVGQLNDEIRKHEFSKTVVLLQTLLERSDLSTEHSDITEWRDLTSIAFQHRQMRTARLMFEKLKEIGNPNADDLRDWAEIAYKERAYETANIVFDALAENGDPYRYNDVARLKHGTVKWTYADHAEFGAEREHEREELLRAAIDLLEEASRHNDPGYEARAYYQQSKVYWHLWRRNQNLPELEAALEKATKAAQTAYEQTYISWWERIERDVSRAKEELVS